MGVEHDDGFGAWLSVAVGFPIGFFILVLVLGLLILVMVMASRTWRADATAPVVSAEATVLAKRIDGSDGNDVAVNGRHYVTFGQSGGERFQLELPVADFSLVVVGDRGSVKMKGTRYLAFAREVGP